VDVESIGCWIWLIGFWLIPSAGLGEVGEAGDEGPPIPSR